ncbi:MAG: ABC transporter permease [Bacteriovoracaceae bacterium]
MKTWTRAILKMEAKNILSYRFEFWVNFLGGTIASFLIAYFLWQNLFEAKGVTLIGGMSFRGMILYYVIAPLVTRVLDADSMGFMSREIYDGSLNKYLIYPIEFFLYKGISYFVRGAFYLLQLFLFLTIFISIMGVPPEFHLSLLSLFVFICFIAIAMPVYYLLVANIEMISFWADNTWSLRVFIFLLISFLGGTMIPLNLFPAWSFPLLKILPFRSMIYLPTQFLLGNQWELIPEALMTLFIWGTILSLSLRLLWKKGLKVYTGVGM